MSGSVTSALARSSVSVNSSWAVTAMATSTACLHKSIYSTVIPVQTKLLPRAERRASILQGAAEAFARSGFAHTSMEDVAAACGVTRLILYRHFETKEELYRASSRRSSTNGPGASVGAGRRLDPGPRRPDPAHGCARGTGRVHAALAPRRREPQFAEYASELRSISVEVVRQFIPVRSGDATLDRWMGESLFGWLVEATLTWLERGDPSLDAEFGGTLRRPG